MSTAVSQNPRNLPTPPIEVAQLAPDSKPPPKQETMPFDFLSLPAEIRSQVYAELVGSRQNKQYLPDGYARYHFHLSILQACKQTYSEARETFRRENVFCKIVTPWREAEEHVAVEGRVPMVLVDGAAQAFQGVHLAAEIDVPAMTYSPNTNSTLLLCLDDLPGFCKMWLYRDLSHPDLNSHLRLKLHVQDPNLTHWSDSDRGLIRPLQRTLLDPFVMIKGLRDFEIDGDVDEIVVQDLRKRMAEPYESPEQCLQKTDAFMEEGLHLSKEADALYEAGFSGLEKFKDSEAVESKPRSVKPSKEAEILSRKQKLAGAGARYRKATTCFEQSFGAMHIVVAGRRRHIYGDHHFDKLLIGGSYDKQDGNYVRMILRIKLVEQMVLAYYKLGLTHDAIRVCDQATSQSSKSEAVPEASVDASPSPRHSSEVADSSASGSRIVARGSDNKVSGWSSAACSDGDYSKAISGSVFEFTSASHFYEDARFWGIRSITMMRDALGDGADLPRPQFQAGGSWGQIYYRTGLACGKLGDPSEARNLIRIAAEWLPNDAEVQHARRETVLKLD